MLLTKKQFTIVLTLVIASTACANVETVSPETLAYVASEKAKQKADWESARPFAEKLGLSQEKYLERNQMILAKVENSLPSPFNNQLELESEPTFAGTWMQQYPTPKFIIAYAGSDGYERGKVFVAKIAAKNHGFWVNYFEVRQAVISMTELKTIKEKFDVGFKELNIKHESGTDYARSDPFILYQVLQPVKTVQDNLRKIGVEPSPFVRIIQIPESELAKPF